MSEEIWEKIKKLSEREGLIYLTDYDISLAKGILEIKEEIDRIIICLEQHWKKIKDL